MRLLLILMTLLCAFQGYGQQDKPALKISGIDQKDRIIHNTRKITGTRLSYCGSIFSYQVVNSRLIILKGGEKAPKLKFLVILKGDSLIKDTATICTIQRCYTGKVITWHHTPAIIVTDTTQFYKTE